MKNVFANAFVDKTILVTGHTGFKGSWLTAWLLDLGARVIGYSLTVPPTQPSNYAAASLSTHVIDVRGDIRDYERLQTTMDQYQPQLVFHMAAQPLVLRGVAEPKLTFDTNAGGTVNMLEAVRVSDYVRAAVMITTDKVYQNNEWLWGYRENDRLGGHAPYSASKSMAELATDAYRHTFFPPSRFDEHGVAVAAVRAGNVIGGGDFAEYRLVPDCLKALMSGEAIGIRNPVSVRPWQHVLEPLSGYLQLAARMLADGAAYSQAWNFGPLEQRGITTQEIAEKLVELWGSGSWVHTDPGYAQVETGQLRLSSEKAAVNLGWRPVYSWDKALQEIVDWFKAYQADEDMFAVVKDHIHAYIGQAQALDLPWTNGL